LRAAFVASCLRGALPPVDLRAVCFVRAILTHAMCLVFPLSKKKRMSNRPFVEHIYNLL
jgi:hypothetical protein